MTVGEKAPEAAAPAPSAAPVGRSTGRGKAETRAAWLFLAPDLLGLLTFLGLPMVLSVALAFMRVDGFGTYEFVGLENFRRMLGDPQFYDSLRLTLVYLVLVVPLTFGASLGLAVLIQRRMPFVGVFRSAFFLPYSVSVVVVGLVWEFMLSDDVGVVGIALRAVGVRPPSWLGDPDFALFTVVGLCVWFWMGYYMIIFLAGLQDIPRDYYEAARLDGAGAWAVFRHITWPLLAPTSFFVLLTLTVAAVTGGFELILVLTNGGPSNGTSVLVFYIYQQAFTFGEFGYASALSAFLVLILLAWSMMLFALTRGGRFSHGRS
ncbi:carbohydrate ABC transporter membrane protein 1 (CUT1 family) [Murinocardiopsis flavida]|uniref:Carbohydrate ABC transporter membrane protein 1 (CUT1 family) n=1 Tax=Murinocardiopsis flavida TaxID=645275 RepID=A0A2P8CW38_9ACTN|nr:sugar ABC transporter permease [Murinocardiopsis flavida]PSK89175.1 carbohydrate ABC transporter membrane protein 1 (CUT1 family) [Murinocardiopsis flavida]